MRDNTMQNKKNNWVSYVNGNYTVRLNLKDGTKIRETNEDEFIPSFPESMDISITDRCDKECSFCYAGATPDGKHGDILGAKFIDTLRPYTEVALNGNDLTHPDLMEFLIKLKNKEIIASMTVNQVHFMKHISLIMTLVDRELIKGLGISLVNPTEDFIDKIQLFPNAVIHVINGITTFEQMEKLYDKSLKILILGYKAIGRGKDYFSREVEDNSTTIYEKLESIIPRFRVISFDNLALSQLEVKNLMPESKWDEFYMGDDGVTSLYIDLAKGYFSKNSMIEVKYGILDNIEEMYKVIKQQKER